MKLNIALAAKELARNYFANHPYYIHYRGTIGDWTYFRIKQKGMPRYTGFGSLIRVYKNGKVDETIYFLPHFMWTKSVKDTPINRERIASHIRYEKITNKKSAESLCRHSE